MAACLKLSGTHPEDIELLIIVKMCVLKQLKTSFKSAVGMMSTGLEDG